VSDRLQRISDNAGRIYAALLGSLDPKAVAGHPEMIASVVATAIQIEQEVVKQIGAAFAPSKPPKVCRCEVVNGDNPECPLHGEGA